MAPLLRRRLTCFYCGRRSTKSHNDTLQQWQCSNCEAVNHLDENGNITDPPAPSALPSKRYAQPHSQPSSFHSSESPFCALCNKNQNFYTQSLASYLPSPTDPQYPAYEAHLPSYIQQLEARYPQVCGECEPRVRNRIRSTQYAAKTDHLRRLMEETRPDRARRAWTWKWVAVYVGALAWWMALLAQVVGSAMGALVADGEGWGEGKGERGSLVRCVQASVRAGQVEGSCARSAARLAGFALVPGLLSMWWNPCLGPKLLGVRGRMVGLGEFYKLQVLLNVMRAVAWYYLDYREGFGNDGMTVKAVRATMLVLNVALSTILYRTARVDSTPRVVFEDTSEPLLAEGPRSTSNTNTQTPIQPNSTSFGAPYQQLVQPFPINNLAPASLHQTPLYQSPTPPPDEDDDGDEMDWTPNKPSFNPLQSPRIHQSTPTRAEPSPFHGRLPPPPLSQAHKLRNPPNQPTFRKASEKQQQNFFNSLRPPPPTQTNAPSRPDSPTLPETQTHQPPRPPITIAPAKFFPPSDSTTDTGLESLISTVFSLDDSPPPTTTTLRSQPLPLPPLSPWHHPTHILLLTLALALYLLPPTHTNPYLRTTALGLAAAISGRNFLASVRLDGPVCSLSDVLVLGAETLAAVLLGGAVNVSGLGDGDGEEGVGVGSAPLWLLGLLLVQEGVAAWRVWRGRRAHEGRGMHAPLSGGPMGRERGDESAGTLGVALQPKWQTAKGGSVDAPFGLSGRESGAAEVGSRAVMTTAVWRGERNLGVGMMRVRRGDGVPGWGRGTL